jgi:hypothetical protein
VRWSRITLEAVCIHGSRRAPNAPRYTVDLPLISDGRIAMHELAANQQRAVVARELPEGGVVAGALEVKDKQCIFTWGTGPAEALPPTRLYGTNFHLGVTIALRPGSGPTQLFEVVECDHLPGDGRKRPA